jgi:hypothetical protein
MFNRLAAFYLMSITISGFSSILAYVFSLLDGRRGIAGWSWIFVINLLRQLTLGYPDKLCQIIEGAITMFLGVIGYFIMPDFPDKNTFLTPEQTALVLKRVELDRHDSVPDPITFTKVMHHLQDWTLWAYGKLLAEYSSPLMLNATLGVMFACSTLPAYMLAYFISIILRGMGFSTADSLLLVCTSRPFISTTCVSLTHLLQSAPPYGPAVSSFKLK